jgi:hypothetical protein
MLEFNQDVESYLLLTTHSSLSARERLYVRDKS